MSTQNRKTLYSYFEEGKLPSTQDFKDLVDSTLNVYDEGFHKTPLNGVKISTPVGPYSALLSFYREASFSVDSDKDTPLWAVRYGQDPYPLLFQIGTGGTPVLSLHQRKDQLPQRVGINTDRPRHALEVAGTVGARGRIGTYPLHKPADDQEALVADGDWKPLTDWLEGNQGFEVVASAGKPNAKRCALMHAIALNVYRAKARWFDLGARRNRIRCHNAWSSEVCESLELQWQREDEIAKATPAQKKSRRYRLLIRSRCDYESNPPVAIEVHLTQLWSSDAPPVPELQAEAPARQEPSL